VPNRSQSTARSSAAPPADADSHQVGVSFDHVGPEDEERLLLVVLEAAVDQRERGPRLVGWALANDIDVWSRCLAYDTFGR
jgi:hypothetical protein